jgi:hypothetical protein
MLYNSLRSLVYFIANFCLLRSYKQYVLSQGEEFDPQSFYTQFGFKTRLFAEDELKIAVRAVYNETEDEQLKSYLFEEYIRNDFVVRAFFEDINHSAFN